MKEKLLGAEHPDTALTRHNLADFLAAEGRTEEARVLSAAAVRTFEMLLPADHPKVVATRGLLRRLQDREVRENSSYRRVNAISR